MDGHVFDAELVTWEAHPDSWVFVELPQELSQEISDTLTGPPRGFGSVRVEVQVGGTTWRTSVFPSKERETFVLPVKRPVRRAEGMEPGDRVRFSLRVLE